MGFAFDNGGRRCIRPILEKYQSGKESINYAYFKRLTGMKLIFILIKGESEGYSVKSREEVFPISNYPLEQTEFFYSQKQGIASPLIQCLKHFTGIHTYFFSLHTVNKACSKGRDKLGNEKSKLFDYSIFNYRNDRTHHSVMVQES